MIALETSAIKIREDDGIKGITIRDEPVKLSLFTDDMTCFIKDSKPILYAEDFWWMFCLKILGVNVFKCILCTQWFRGPTNKFRLLIASMKSR